MVISTLQAILEIQIAILAEIKKGNRLLMTVDESIAAYAADMKTKLQSISDGLVSITTSAANIATDEANLLDQIKQLNASVGTGTLSQPSQDLLNGLLATASTMSTNSQALVAQAKTLADAVPDVVTPPPPSGGPSA